MPENSPIDQEIASIRAKHDKHDYSQALTEVQQDLGKHSKNGAEQTEFERKLVASGLISDLALEWGREHLSHNSIGIASRQQVQATEKSDNAVDRIMATQIDHDWDRLSTEARGTRFISARQLADALRTKALTEPFRTDPNLFDQLKNNGDGSGLIFTHANEITPESLRAAVRPDSAGLSDQQRLVAQKLLDNFDSAGLQSIESGNIFTGRGITREALNTFLKNNPAAPTENQTPAPTVTAALDSGVEPPRRVPPAELPPTSSSPTPAPLPEAVQRTASPAPLEPPPAASPPPERAPTAPPPVQEVTTPAPTIAAIPQEVATTGALPPKESDEGKAIRTAPSTPETPQPGAPFSNKINAGEGPYQSFRSANPNWTHQQALDAAHAVKKQLGREEFRQGEQFRTNADGSITSRLEDRRQPGVYTETTGKDGHTNAVKSGDASGNWTNTTFDATGKPTGSTEHKITADGFSDIVRGADGKAISAYVHKKNADGSSDDAKLNGSGNVIERSHINADGTATRKIMDADGSHTTEMHFDKEGHETSSQQFTKNADGSTDLTVYNQDEKAVANHHVNADGSLVDRQMDPNNPNVFKETKSDKDGKSIAGSDQDASGNHRAWTLNADKSTTYTVESADKRSMYQIDASGKFVKSIEINNENHIAIDIAQEDGKWVKTTHSPGKPDLKEIVEQPAVPPPPKSTNI